MIQKQQELKLKNGKEVILRSLIKADAQGLIHQSMEIAKESEYMLREQEEVEQDKTIVEERIQKMADSEDQIYIGAFLNGVLVGHIGVYRMNPLRRTAHRCSIGVGVMKDYRAQGIATALLHAAIEVAQRFGYEQMELDVVEENTSAIHVYEQAGFQITGRLPHATKMKDGRYHDCLYMVKMLALIQTVG